MTDPAIPRQTSTWPRVEQLDSSEGNVVKFVFTKDDAVAEAVLYRYPTYADRTVICCSTQSGCPVGCRFCGAGDAFVRNLTTAEIVAQVERALLTPLQEGVRPSNIYRLQVMFMSMGEPMLNLKHLIPALYELAASYPNAELLISTSAPRVGWHDLLKVSVELPQIGLQFSVHESTDGARDKLIPFAAKLDLAGIAEAGEHWAKVTGRQPFFNYCVHENNSSQEDVDRLAALFDPDIWQATVSVISERDETLSVAHARQRDITASFMAKIIAKGYSARVFDPAGQDDIGGGCGQLHYVQQWFKHHPDTARPSVGSQFPIIHTPQEDQ